MLRAEPGGLALVHGVMGSRLHPWLALALALVLSAAVATDAASATPDPAARGLDAFVHFAPQAGSLDRFPLQILVYGFATVRTASPLPGAKVEASWDPETLGPDAERVPEPVATLTNAGGQARLEVVMPPGPPGKLRLLIGLRYGAHERTRTVEVARQPTLDVVLQVAEHRVVPGSTIPAWVLVQNAASGAPVASVPLELSLLEGGIARFTARLATDATGSALGRIPIPLADAPGWQWTLRARIAGAGPGGGPDAEVTLVPRDETPARPTLEAEWAAGSVRPGEKAGFLLRLRDAADEPVGAQSLRYWIGPKGTRPPDEPEAWRKASTAVTTDLTGQVRGETVAPSTVAPRVGTQLQLVVRTELDGQPLHKETTIDVGKSSPSVELLPEDGSLLGGVDQRLLLRARDELGAPVRTSFHLTGDALDAEVTTNADGEADLAWRAPRDVGAFRGVGPCAQHVAASVSVRPLEAVAALGGRIEPFELCVPVDRDAPAVVRIEPPLAVAGDKVRVRLLGGRKGPWSVVLRAAQGNGAASAWLEDPEQGVEIPLPAGASGLWTVAAAPPGAKTGPSLAVGEVLVRPRILPALEARIVGGRAVPRGTVRVEAALSDGHGKPLSGSVAAVVQDRYGGGSVDELWRLDARRSLCALLDIEQERCRGLLEGDGSWDPVRRGLLGRERGSSVAPEIDPAGQLDAELAGAFEAVVHSLEGAVLESATSPETLRDVRRKGKDGHWSFNPELWTLTTAAMTEPPTTPGGEPFELADLVAIDRQVSFDNVARRVTRLKLFRALAAVHRHIQSNELGSDEPALRDPAAMLRRMVRAGELSEADLLAPWGGTMQFVPSRGSGLPFLSLRGYELHAPGPDGRLGTADDVRDPFERVLASRSPYAEAVREDELCDARLDMQVSEATVAGWQSLLEALTGTALGQVGTIGHGAGTGTGQGFGSGHGRLGSSHVGSKPRWSQGLSNGDAVWIAPVHTDANGKVVLEVPLGSAETTWRVALVGIPAEAEPAVAMLDVPVSLPVSARVEAGARWTEGDQAEVRITVRNRTDARVSAELAINPSGVAKLVTASSAHRTVEVPARGATEVRVAVGAPAVGEAGLEVHTRVAGSPEDVLHHSWDVKPAAERTDVTQMAWIDGEKTVSLPLDPKRVRVVGAVELELERGQEPAVSAALDSLEPDRLRTPAALGDALDTAMRVRRWAIGRGGEADPLAARALDVARRALGRISLYAEAHRTPAPWKNLATRAKLDGSLGEQAPAAASKGRPRVQPPVELPSCPPDEGLGADLGLDWLELEQAPVGGAILSCWDALVTDLSGAVQRQADSIGLARLVLSLSDEAHHQPEALALAARLRERVGLHDTGYVELSGTDSASRASRALVYAALLRSALLEPKPLVSAERLAPWLLLQRDGTGGFGSSRATRAAVQALLAMSLAEAKGTVAITVQAGGKTERFELGPSARRSLALPADTAEVTVRSEGGPVLGRLVRHKLRPWSEPAPSARGPIHVELAWPTAPTVDVTARLRVTLSQELGRATSVDLRIPLPPGARLVHPVDGVRQVAGVLAIRRQLDQSALPEVMLIPIRFALPGRFTIPEAEARLSFDEAERSLAAARPIVVR